MIYFIQAGKNGPIKIGYTKNKQTFKTRLKTLQIANPEKLRLRCLIKGSMTAEHSLHRKFRHFYIHGEWFQPNKILLTHITNQFHSLISFMAEEYNPSFELSEDIDSVLIKTGGNKAKAARLLGISRATLYRRLKEDL